MAVFVARSIGDLSRHHWCTTTPSPLLQFFRYKGGIKPHGKPRFIPRAPSKMFKLAAVNHISDSEINQILSLKFAHHDKVSAITQYLWEDYLKYSDVGEAGKLEAQREEEEHRRLLEENDELNQKVALQREERLVQEAKQTEERIARELEEHAERERKRLALAEKMIRAETKDLANVIACPEDLEKAILVAMDNPVEYEFSIDLEGHIYPGRNTKATKVPKEDRQKIASPMREGELILGIDKEQYTSSN